MLDMNLYIEISHRAYWRHGRVRCILSEPPNKQALRIAQDSDLRSGSDRLRPLSTWKQAQRCVRPCGTPCTFGKSTRYTSHGVRRHQHMSTGTYTTHHALHRVSRILNISQPCFHAYRDRIYSTSDSSRPHAPHPPQCNSHPNTHHIHMSKPRVGKRPAPLRHRSQTLSPPLRQSQHHFSVAKSVASTARARCEHASV